MNTARNVIHYSLIVCLLVFSSALAQAAETGGQLLCAFTKSSVCDSDGCTAADLEALDLPPFFKVDFKNKLITDVEAMGGRTARKKTPIREIHHADGNIILQVIQIRAWSILISEKTGKFTLTASDDEEAGIFFGVCTPI